MKMIDMTQDNKMSRKENWNEKNTKNTHPNHHWIGSRSGNWASE